MRMLMSERFGSAYLFTYSIMVRFPCASLSRTRILQTFYPTLGDVLCWTACADGKGILILTTSFSRLFVCEEVLFLPPSGYMASLCFSIRTEGVTSLESLQPCSHSPILK